jgi:uncharacterized protein YbjT (DUF2867 family)
MSETAPQNQAQAPTQPSVTDAPSVNQSFPARVAVTGATGFVGRAVVRELVARGHRPVCLVRDRLRFLSSVGELGSDQLDTVTGDLFDATALRQVVEGAEAMIHLVGIIFEKPLRGQTFQRIHVEGTKAVLEMCAAAGVRRYLHMSALGTRAGAASAYHRTKWEAEGAVRASGLDWTIFRPSVIHGPDGEFMRMMRVMVCDAMVMSLGIVPTPFPVMPYFGDGMNRLQPVSVRDVAACFVSALIKPETVGQVYELGGPEAITWKELYRICRETIPGAKRWKPMVSQPVWAAKLLASTVMKLPILPSMLRFNADQVTMSQEDAVCDSSLIERTFDLKLRDFRAELREYAALIE